jgi:hypothetical protein
VVAIHTLTVAVIVSKDLQRLRNSPREQLHNAWMDHTALASIAAEHAHIMEESQDGCKLSWLTHQQ